MPQSISVTQNRHNLSRACHAAWCVVVVVLQSYAVVSSCMTTLLF